MNNIYNGLILLTSTGLSNPVVMDRFLAVVKNKKNKVAIVTTAAEGKEKNKFSQLAMRQFYENGFRTVDYIDLDNYQVDLTEYDILYVCGGNTFKLLKSAKKVQFKKVIDKLLNKGGIYLGVSAGSLIMTPSISIAAEVNPDKNEVGIKDLRAFNYVDFDFYPHYSVEVENEIRDYERRHKIKVMRITNQQALIFQRGQVELIN